ncbi:hypothetical protein [Amycolatopsis circi]|uniref:hypothetical protein n=1 Tax=Amycolatopsis circi TaxID=871959 RepID=UPI0013BE9264|nr:hypothetical protein [Amycolatopsis circi]
MIPLDIPGFMSPAHVDRMNQLLADSAEVRAAAAELGGTYTMTYRLDGAPNGTEYWTTVFGPAGLRFELTAPPSPDVLVRADWTATMSALHAQQDGRDAQPIHEETTGDETLVKRLHHVLALGRRVATIQTRLPDLTEPSPPPR